MKHMLRKPLLPLLLAAVLVFSSSFLAIFREGIRADLERVDEIYRGTRLTFEVVPEAGSVDSMMLNKFTGDQLRSMDEVAKSCAMIRCYASLREPDRLPGEVMAYGTEDPDALAKAKGFSITYGENAEEFSTAACILEEELAAKLGVGPGDTVVIAGTEYPGEDPEAAPSLTLTVVGTCTGYGRNMLIVHCDLFMSKPGLLYNSAMLYDCFYRYCAVEIDPAYNRDYLQVRDKVVEVLGSDGELTIVSNIRTLEQSAGALERKLQVQQLVVTPLTLVLWIAAGVVSLLLGLSFQTEVFLRFMWGEKRHAVFVRLMGAVCGLLALSAAAGLAAVWLGAGSQWLGWAGKYLAGTVALCIFMAAAPLAVFCRRNMIRFYQSREG